MYKGYSKGDLIIAVSMDGDSQAARYAMNQIGKPYTTNLSKRKGDEAFDCSGLVWRAYKEAGYSNIPQTTRDYASSSAVRQISESQLCDGDIVWSEGHVGIYLKNSKFSNHVISALNQGVKALTFEGYKREFGPGLIYYRVNK